MAPRKPTQTQVQQAAAAQAPLGSGEVVQLSPPRLPYPSQAKEAHGVDAGRWRALCEAVFPAARSAEAVLLALDYCKARKLDPFKRTIHIVPIWDSSLGDHGGLRESIWPGIGELRTTASRTGLYAGCEETQFGPMSRREFKGSIKKGNNWQEHKIDMDFPEWAQVTVYKIVKEERVAFPGPRVLFLETYGRRGRNTDMPNDRWTQSPTYMVEKCAEAAALRKAFPEELGDEQSAEEAEGRYPADHMVDITPVPQRPQKPAEEVQTAPSTASVVSPGDVETETPEAADEPGAALDEQFKQTVGPAPAQAVGAPAQTAPQASPALPHLGIPDWSDMAEVAQWLSDVQNLILTAAPNETWLSAAMEMNKAGLVEFSEKYTEQANTLRQQVIARQAELQKAATAAA